MQGISFQVCCMAIAMVLHDDVAAGLDLLDAPKWFIQLMRNRNCTLTKANYNRDKCDLKVMYSGVYPPYIHQIGLGAVSSDSIDDIGDFASAVCACGVFDLRGDCPPELTKFAERLKTEAACPIRPIPIPATANAEEWGTEPTSMENTVGASTEVVELVRTEAELNAEAKILQQVLDSTKEGSVPAGVEDGVQDSGSSSALEDVDEEPSVVEADGIGIVLSMGSDEGDLYEYDEDNVEEYEEDNVEDTENINHADYYNDPSAKLKSGGEDDYQNQYGDFF